MNAAFRVVSQFTAPPKRNAGQPMAEWEQCSGSELRFRAWLSKTSIFKFAATSAFAVASQVSDVVSLSVSLHCLIDQAIAEHGIAAIASSHIV